MFHKANHKRILLMAKKFAYGSNIYGHALDVHKNYHFFTNGDVEKLDDNNKVVELFNVGRELVYEDVRRLNRLQLVW